MYIMEPINLNNHLQYNQPYFQVISEFLLLLLTNMQIVF